MLMFVGLYMLMFVGPFMLMFVGPFRPYAYVCGSVYASACGFVVSILLLSVLVKACGSGGGYMCGVGFTRDKVTVVDISYEFVNEYHALMGQ